MSRRMFRSGRCVARAAAALLCAVAAGLLLAGCTPSYNNRAGYYGGAPGGYYGRQCFQGCGVVREVRQVELNNNGATLGTVIGAIAGGLLGHQIGGGKGKTAATVAGAVGGGFAGHAIGEHSGGNAGWQVVVQLDNGQYATVTQATQPQVRVGDRVIIRDNTAYRD